MVCIVLASGAMIFSKITTDLVISPIEDMIVKVNNITKDPLKAAHDEEERLLYEEIAEKEIAEIAQRNSTGKIVDKKNDKKEGQWRLQCYSRHCRKLVVFWPLALERQDLRLLPKICLREMM